MAAPAAQVDALILGGGVAGLWTLRRLRAAGRHAALLSTTPLGAGQTLASQGIIHGGIKYALGGGPSSASAAIAGMPQFWRACLSGRPAHGHPDLRAARVLAESQFLWTTPGFISKVAAIAAGKAIRTPVEKVAAEHRPGAFAGAPASISIYSVGEPVLDAGSLVDALVAGSPQSIVRADSIEAIEQLGRTGGARVTARCDGQLVQIEAARVVLCAGAGNQALLTLAGSTLAERSMQRRPLHMVMVRSPGLPALFGHCLGASTLPRLTVTSARDTSGRVVWYVGGRIAEEGVGRDRAAQIETMRDEARACVPWAKLEAAEFATLRIDRAEGLTAGGRRPDEPVILEDGPVVAAWPTKLAFAPLLADRVQAIVHATRGTGTARPEAPDGGWEGWPRASRGYLPWEDGGAGVEWTR